MLRKILIVTLIGFSALSLAQAADLTIDKPDVKVGDIWKYRILDGFTNEPKFEINFRTVSISDSEITVRMTWKGNQNSRLAIFDRQWNMLDDGTAKWDPSRSEFKFPMRVGESWARRYQVTNIKTGATSACISDAKVAANEKVTVPAGTFDTIYIKIKDKANNDQISEQWVNPRDIPLSGMVKSLADSQLGKVTIELTSFKK